MRKQLILYLISFLLILPHNLLAKEAKELRELKFGYYVDKVMVSTQTILYDEALTKRINEIGNKVAKASDGPKDMQYTFRVLNDPTINAFAAPAGFVYVNAGLLDILESEDELAAILGHEIAHINEHHQMKLVYAKHRAKVTMEVVGVVLVVAGAAAGSAAGAAAASATSSLIAASVASHLAGCATSTAVQLIGQEAASAMLISIVKGYGKKRELEADALAIKYINNTDYDPYALVSVFKRLITIRDRLNLDEKNYISNMINAEPGLEERIEKAEKLILEHNED